MVSRSIEYVRERVLNTHPRTRKAQLNTLLGLIAKGGSLFISFLLVPLSIDYLSKETYGTWLTISSVITMLSLLDAGIGNGLRNKFSEAVSRQDTDLARTYVSTAYIVFGIIQIVLVLCFLLGYRYIPWQSVFNTKIGIEQLQSVILITVISISVKLVLDIFMSVLLAVQESGKVALINLLSNGLVLLGMYTLTMFSSRELLNVAVVTVISPLVISLISTLITYNKLKIYRPSFSSINFKYARNLLSLGYKFFFIQISVIILFYTDNLIITQLFGSSEVTTYNVAFRYFNSISTIFTIVLTPYWSAFTEASVKKDILWMKRTYHRLQYIWLGLVVVVLCMIGLADNIYTIWIDNRLQIPFRLSLCMGLFVIIYCWNSMTVIVSNGLGKVKLQLYYAIISAMMNIPLAIFLGKALRMGSSGVILASAISLLCGSVLGAIQARKLLTGKASGIWAN